MKNTAISSRAALVPGHRFMSCSFQADRAQIHWMCECVSCPSPLFLAASCSDPGVCSISFLRCPNLGQASFMSSSIVISVPYGCVLSVCIHCMTHGVVNGGGHENLDTELLLCVSTWNSPCVPKHCLTPLRSETDKRGHKVIFPHNDVTAWEKPVRHQLLSQVCLFFFSFSVCFPLGPLPLSFATPDDS